MNDMDQDFDQLERELRAGLNRHAGEAVANPAVLGQVRTTTGRRRRTRWAAIGAAAAAVVGVGATSVIVAGNDSDKPPTAKEVIATDLRAESWGGLTVDVPAAWGYGTTGTEFVGQSCIPVAVKGPQGQPWESDGLPAGVGWVGRPITLTDLCTTTPEPPLAPEGPYVFLDAGIKPGKVDFDNGYVQETVEVEGVALTVATDDAKLRKQIIDSARPETLCEASFENTVPSGETGTTVEGRGDLQKAHACAYRVIDGAFRLTYAASVTPVQAAKAYRAQEDAPKVSHDDACTGEVDEFVLLDAEYDDRYGSEPLHRRAVFEMGCGGEVSLGENALGEDLRTHLVPDGVAPWAVGGIRSTVIGPTMRSDEVMLPYFIGLLG